MSMARRIDRHRFLLVGLALAAALASRRWWLPEAFQESADAALTAFGLLLAGAVSLFLIVSAPPLFRLPRTLVRLLGVALLAGWAWQVYAELMA